MKTQENKPNAEATNRDGNQSLRASGRAVGALPITARASEYNAWRDRLAADRTCCKFSERDEAIAFAAFVAGWWLRTGDNPDDFFNLL
jgi:hypothetical protein